ncbi:expressed unknown protein [Seminavis robusta]|uniref:Uncharacterized protein n=1 Tax=Seminavis robusta TaxID=568900 RepID=A0A9N8DNB2_9STRA|nr:expressed unknown protein [Seminavis robusta]|eukprot:Sro240_g096170.1 n/a (307) ;mRNA; f:64463-65383
MDQHQQHHDGERPDEDDRGHRNNHGPQAILHHLDPGRMDLEQGEILRAWALKNAVEQDPDTSALSDYELVQIALVTTDVDEAMEKVQMLHQFRKEYNIVESVDHARFCIQEVMRLFPGYLLSFTFFREGDMHSGHYGLVQDATKLNAKLIPKSGGPAMNMLLATAYFCFQAMNPDFEAVRRGVVSLLECENFDWKQHVTFGGVKQMYLDFFMHYPTKWHQARNYHTGVLFNLLASMCRPFQTEDLRESWQIGCMSPGGRLDTIFLQPNLQAANERFIHRVANILELRYNHEASFVLPPLVNQPAAG